MKILKVIHGYPLNYNAGSEVYSQILCHGLIKKSHKVDVFTRIEDSFKTDYEMVNSTDADQPGIKLHCINMARAKDGYYHKEVDKKFKEVLEEFKPDIVHIGHLNHLSTSLPVIAKSNKIPVIYTLHDYWLMCPRGQFMQMFPEKRFNKNDLWKDCGGQENRKCAERCYLRYFSGMEKDYEEDLSYWTGWVKRRMAHIRDVCQSVDLFIAPSKYLLKRYRDDFEIPDDKLIYLDYGFDLDRMKNRVRDNKSDSFTFGYIGTHIPAKGIHLLLNAFGKVKGNPVLKIWGRPRGQDTESLKEIARSLQNDSGKRVHWVSEYKNQNIVKEVFNNVDAIVVPSVWVENSPLVIHEAQQARVPVITANTGGMAEYVHHEKNGLLFKHRSYEDLAIQMQRFVDLPDDAKKFGQRGYLYSANGDVPSIENHVSEIIKLYKRFIDE